MPRWSEREGGWRQFDSSQVGIPSRTPAWERVTRDLFLPLRIASRTGQVSGTIAGLHRGPIRTLRLRSTAHYGVRTRDLAAGTGAEQVTIAFATSGQLQVRQHGRGVTLTPGQFTIYDTSDAFAVGSGAPFGARMAMFPRDALGLSSGLLAGLAARRFEVAEAARISAILAECEHGEALSTEPLEEIGRILFASGPMRADRPEPVGRSDGELADAAVQLIQSCLGDRRLSPDYIAGVLGVSRRRLYYACADTVGPLATYIRRMRMAHALILLRDPDWQGANVAEIADACGFDDPAHFARVFRRNYGLPPSRARRGASTGETTEP